MIALQWLSSFVFFALFFCSADNRHSEMLWPLLCAGTPPRVGSRMLKVFYMVPFFLSHFIDYIQIYADWKFSITQIQIKVRERENYGQLYCCHRFEKPLSFNHIFDRIKSNLIFFLGYLWEWPLFGALWEYFEFASCWWRSIKSVALLHNRFGVRLNRNTPFGLRLTCYFDTQKFEYRFVYSWIKTRPNPESHNETFFLRCKTILHIHSRRPIE